jgi:hypothetical protein
MRNYDRSHPQSLTDEKRMRRYQIESTHKMNTYAAYLTAKKVVESLNIRLELPIQTAQGYQKRQCGGIDLDWESISLYSLSRFSLIVCVYQNIEAVEFNLPFLTITECLPPYVMRIDSPNN